MQYILHLGEREENREGASFALSAFHFYAAVVRFHHGFYVAEAEAKALHIMQVAGMGPVKFLEYTRLGLFVHTNAIVSHLNGKHPVDIFR